MKNIFKRIIYWAGSLKLALVLVIALILLSFIALIVPQTSEYTAAEINSWSELNPGRTSLVRVFGFFSVFRSIPFLIVIILFATNILICTILHLSGLKESSNYKRKRGIRTIGFLLLHIALIGILAGGFITTALGKDGSIILTEGQIFANKAENYINLTKGSFSSKSDKNFRVRLSKVKIKYENKVIPVKVVTTLDFKSKTEEKNGVDIEINKPYSFEGFDFTQDEIGFSPRIIIRDPLKKQLMLNSFVALKTFREGENWQYRDFLPLPFLKNKVILTLFPDHMIIESVVKKTSELKGQPILLFEERDENDKLVSSGTISFRGSSKIGDYQFEFAELRYWASFRVVDDPGYIVFGLSIWLALFSLVLRYSEDLISLFKKDGKILISNRE
ncbi:MAG: cytochrome c biogenesis protein ResB [Candidatus Aminicenantes bacterium]|nr:cytochrome c biogenesis protein ResB [Candidatus Aminicenantes bacterium]